MELRPWAFIDYENIGKLTDLDLNPYAYVLLFLGAQQTKVEFAQVAKQGPTYFTFRVSESGKNSLDMHLAYYLGIFGNKLDKRVCFDVISKDQDFAPIVRTISQKRPCRLLSREAVLAKKAAKPAVAKPPAAKPPAAKPAVAKPPAQVTKLEQRIAKILSPDCKHRPKTRTALYNHLKSGLNPANSAQLVEQKLQQLLEGKAMSFEGDKVHYHKLG